MKFISKYPNLRLVMKPSYYIVVNGMRQRVSGKTIEFENGVYETNNKDEIEFIKKSQEFGVSVFAEEGVSKPSESAKKEEKERKKVTKIAAFECPYCNFKTDNKPDLDSHIEKKHA